MAILIENESKLKTQRGLDLLPEQSTLPQTLIYVRQRVGALININQDCQKVFPSNAVIGVEQKVGVYFESATLIDVEQLNVFVSVFQNKRLIELEQKTKSERPVGKLFRLRQINLLPQSSEQVGAELSPVIIRLDGEEISDLCDNAFSVTGTESENRINQIIADSYLPQRSRLID